MLFIELAFAPLQFMTTFYDAWTGPMPSPSVRKALSGPAQVIVITEERRLRMRQRMLKRKLRGY
jgi:hypothetical protein